MMNNDGEMLNKFVNNAIINIVYNFIIFISFTFLLKIDKNLTIK